MNAMTRRAARLGSTFGIGLWLLAGLGLSTVQVAAAAEQPVAAMAESQILEKQQSLGFTGPVREGRYLRVDDFDMWVEVSGEGPPLMVLNGGFGMTTMAESMVSEFAKYFTVYSFDARGHGRSGFGSGPVTYAREAADVVALMDVLGLETAHIFGHSDGGCASLHLLFDYPHRIRTSTLSGTPYHQSVYNEMAKGFVKDFPELLASGKPDPLGFTPMLLKMGMSEGKIQRLGGKLDRAWSTTPNFTLEMLTTIDNPVLVVEAGADEFIAPKHFVEITQAIPNARAINLPEMTHNPRPYVAQLAKAAAELAAAFEVEGEEKK
ncbi:alpha/beta hydrolase [Pseudomaricurvus alkylphenolicus]|uniref:alpha/beta fold hydrolase n=1 Tax=Pseudomaricurvus alkylphenolicus TaxID=1306991 RepID=UPI001422475E|nr:alpha/beta hydrolase [Pseudomaricurvus alkylphenolicus]NIB45106.1 alpha/beta hydrolase [Pseudomaricurvus alkylphenolicus]